jgi:hypothetical protein
MIRPARDTTLIARARRRLTRWPELRYDATHTWLRIPAPHAGGFDIELQSRRNRYTVRLEGWTRTFDRDDDALDCLELALSDACRLAVTCRGKTSVAWTLEVREYGMWVPHRRVRRRLVPFWRGERMEYRQNDVIGRA